MTNKLFFLKKIDPFFVAFVTLGFFYLAPASIPYVFAAHAFNAFVFKTSNKFCNEKLKKIATKGFNLLNVFLCQNAKNEITRRLETVGFPLHYASTTAVALCLGVAAVHCRFASNLMESADAKSTGKTHSHKDEPSYFETFFTKVSAQLSKLFVPVDMPLLGYAFNSITSCTLTRGFNPEKYPNEGYFWTTILSKSFFAALSKESATHLAGTKNLSTGALALSDIFKQTLEETMKVFCITPYFKQSKKAESSEPKKER